MKKYILLFASLACSFTAFDVFAQDMVRVPASGDKATAYQACSIESVSCKNLESNTQLTTPSCEWVNTCQPEKLKKTTIEAFYIDAIPVTNEALQKCLSEGHCTKTDIDYSKMNIDTTSPKLPAVVDYQLAEEYCASMGKSLPTEEQWLAAAMGDNVQKYAWGDDELLTATVQIPWYNFSNLVDAGSMPTDQINGIYDMTGNGYEWIKADVIKAYIPENVLCDEPDSRPCMGGAPLPLYQKIGIYAHTPATFRCVKDVE